MLLQITISGNTYNPLDPVSVEEAARRTNQSTKAWRGKANSFHLLRGLKPSFGYFLLEGTTSLTGPARS